EIYAPNEKKSFLSVSGEWSGLMESKLNSSDGNKQKPEVFVDVNCIPIFKKNVRPIAEQTEMESRRIWMEVTAGLRLNDIDRATNAKSQVEQKQRNEAKLRKEKNEEWETKNFKPVGDSWIYTKPLSQRLLMEQINEKR
ncbi:Oxysterol-binding protein-related protein 9, partial [Pseudolycoriella hygida]